MAVMNRPAPGTGNGPPMGNGADDAGRRRALYGLSPDDPRLIMADRIDQRYGNYQYGPTPEYAQENAQRMQDAGNAAQQTLGGYGTQTYQAGEGIEGRATPGTDYYNANQALSGVNQTAGDQGDLYGRLINYAEQGPGESEAQAQLARSTADAQKQQFALAGAGRGQGGGAAAYRNAAFQSADIAGDANAQASVLRAQEADAWRQRQLQAYGMGGDVLSQQAQTQMGVADQYAGQSEFLTQAELEAQAQRDQAGLAYRQAGLDSMNQGYATQLGYEQEGRTHTENELDANMGYEQNLTNLATNRSSLQNAREQREHDRDGQWIGAAMGAATSVGALALMASDEERKNRIRPTHVTNQDDFNSMGWHRPGSEGHKQAGQKDDQDASFKKLQEDRKKRQEEDEKADRARKAQMAMSVYSSVSGPFMSSDRSRKTKIQPVSILSQIDPYSVADPYSSLLGV